VALSTISAFSGTDLQITNLYSFWNTESLTEERIFLKSSFTLSGNLGGGAFSTVTSVCTGVVGVSVLISTRVSTS
jgi:hypothetical protein